MNLVSASTTDLGAPTREAEINCLCQMFCAYWVQHPEYRFGQALSNLLGVGRQDVFHVTDQQVLEGMAPEIGLERKKVDKRKCGGMHCAVGYDV